MPWFKSRRRSASDDRRRSESVDGSGSDTEVPAPPPMPPQNTDGLQSVSSRSEIAPDGGAGRDGGDASDGESAANERRSLVNNEAKARRSVYGATEAGAFEAINGYSWDLAFVLPVRDAGGREPPVDLWGKPLLSWAQIVSRLHGARLHTHAFHSVQKDEVYVKVRSSVRRLAEWADHIDYPLRLETQRLLAACAKGIPDSGIGPLEINDDGTELRATEYIYGRYDTDERLAGLYANAADGTQNHPFSSCHRLKLLLMIIEVAQGATELVDWEAGERGAG